LAGTATRHNHVFSDYVDNNSPKAAKLRSVDHGRNQVTRECNINHPSHRLRRSLHGRPRHHRRAQQLPHHTETAYRQAKQTTSKLHRINGPIVPVYQTLSLFLDDDDIRDTQGLPRISLGDCSRYCHAVTAVTVTMIQRTGQSQANCGVRMKYHRHLLAVTDRTSRSVCEPSAILSVATGISTRIEKQ
jgi:hypothetical protein